ncbi:unnamed protein product [Heligmosomoides polygyrus]|uniref:Reverse transcriptase domain-containing protein n=1 Tax=Heligmosomoides polygyrus TaxID=6339 RepID=A0A3P7Z9G2_HELPZ|nr:unnamed protein product [Heligmosomoides polygyrus]
MKIFERILDRRIRENVKLSDSQCGFVSGCGTIDAIHATRLLVEKHREKQKPVHIAFLGLEKAFDRVPRKTGFRSHDSDQMAARQWLTTARRCMPQPQ